MLRKVIEIECNERFYVNNDEKVKLKLDYLYDKYKELPFDYKQDFYYVVRNNILSDILLQSLDNDSLDFVKNKEFKKDIDCLFIFLQCYYNLIYNDKIQNLLG